MKKKRCEITGILLSGGKSSRMGREKGRLRIGKAFLYQYPLKALESVCDHILISTCNEELLAENYDHVCDEIPGIGPIGGIYTALKHSKTDINIVVSYDLPLVTPDLFKELLKHKYEADIVLPGMTADKPEPLCGIYHRNVTDSILEQINKMNYAVHGLQEHVNSRLILINEHMSFYRSELFLNINREEDLKKLPDNLSLL